MIGDLGSMMKQAQKMQEKLEGMKKEMENQEYEGKSGGGLVKVLLTGKSDLKKVSIDPSLFNSEDAEVVEDLIVAAFNDAKNKLDEGSKKAMEDLTGGLNLPPGFNLPF